jgi:hypothetical protein
VLVGDVAGDGLDQVLDGHETVDPAIFIDHQGEMHPRLAHLQQQVEHRDLRRHHQRPAQDGAQVEILGPADIGVDVLDVDHAENVVQLRLIDRETRMSLAPDQFEHLVEAGIDRDRHDIGARHHHVLGGGAAQAQHIGDQRPLLAVEFRPLARLVRRARRLLHQFGDRFAHAVFHLPAPQQAAQPRQQRPMGGGAHGRRHGLGMRSRASSRASVISIRRASPAC